MTVAVTMAMTMAMTMTVETQRGTNIAGLFGIVVRQANTTITVAPSGE